MKKIIMNQAGNLSMGISGVLAIASAIVIGISKDQDTQLNQAKSSMERVEGQALMHKMKTLANFLVSSNVILCKSDPYKGSNERNRCSWGGVQYSGGESVPLDKSKLGFDNGSYDKNGFLVFNVDTNKIQEKSEDGSDTENEEYELSGIKGSIGFKLYDFTDDPLNLAKNFGEIPNANIDSDNDRTIVLVKAEIKVSQKFIKKRSVDENGEVTITKEKSDGFTVKNYFGIRRPIAIPKIEIGNAVCAAGCRPSIGLDDNMACRSKQSFEHADEVEITAKVTNLGPGVLYKLALEKNVEYDAEKYPNQKQPDPVAINIIGSTSVEYLMPGQTAEWSDSVKCLTFTTSTNEKIYQSTASGICYKYDPNYRVVECPTSDSNITDVKQHSTGGGQIKYKLDISPVATKYRYEKLYPFKDLAKSKRFSSFFKENFAINVKVPEEFKNTSLSVIEPARVALPIDEINGVPVKEELQTNIDIIPTH